jgi:hypothetical protein
MHLHMCLPMVCVHSPSLEEQIVTDIVTVPFVGRGRRGKGDPFFTLALFGVILLQYACITHLIHTNKQQLL